MFTAYHASNWHPLTWLSHGIDYALWGLNPMGHHLTSVLLHGLNTFLVVILITRLVSFTRMDETAQIRNTRSAIHNPLIIGAVTGLLFGVHPLHVESVAWVSERKDVLYAFFYLLSILAYVRYVRAEAGKRAVPYVVCLVLFVFSLLSKSMAVTLPVVLLILDVYPFGRTGVRGLFTNQWRLLVEKVPFFVLSIVSSVLTLQAQGTGGSIVPVWVHPLGDRVLIAVKGLCYYLLKTIWPSGLVPLYPFPIQISVGFEYIVSFIAVTGLTLLSLWLWVKKKRIFLIVWLSYIVMLSPVLGIVQTGGHAVANRYTYLPLLGPFLLLWIGVERMWTKTDETWRRRVPLKVVFFALLLVLMMFLSLLTIKQGRVWKDSLSLWNEEILHFPSIHVAYDSRADAYVKMGKYQGAIADLNRSLSINPQYPWTYYRLGLVHERTGTYLQAMQNHGKALELFAGFKPARQGRERAYHKAIEDLSRDINNNPLNGVLYMNRGNVHALMEHSVWSSLI
jgi:hypothetical protein